MRIYKDPLLKLNENRLFYKGEEITASTRIMAEERPVCYDRPGIMKIPDHIVLYYMFRGLEQKSNLRYDITFIPPFMLGKEFVKTIGHYHEEAKPGLTYPEVYEVLHGEAHYLLQEKKGSELGEILLVSAKAGEKVIVPPNYGHVTINPSPHLLVMANVVAANFKSIYGDYQEKKGAAYFELSSGMVPNKHYGKLAKPVEIGAEEFAGRYQWPKEVKGRGLLHLLLDEPELFAWLNEPGLLK